MSDNDRANEIGALWLKTSAKGTKFYSGILNIDGKKLDIVCFKNTKKSSDKQPDFRVLLSQRQNSSSAAPKKAATKPANTAAAGSVPATPEGEDDIPF